MLERTRLFSGLRPWELQVLAKLAAVRQREVPKYGVVHREGCVTTQMVIVARGSVAITSADDPEWVQREPLGVGGVLGAAALVVNTPRRESAVATEATTLLTIGKLREMLNPPQASTRASSDKLTVKPAVRAVAATTSPLRTSTESSEAREARRRRRLRMKQLLRRVIDQRRRMHAISSPSIRGPERGSDEHGSDPTCDENSPQQPPSRVDALAKHREEDGHHKHGRVMQAAVMEAHRLMIDQLQAEEEAQRASAISAAEAAAAAPGIEAYEAVTRLSMSRRDELRGKILFVLRREGLVTEEELEGEFKSPNSEHAGDGHIRTRAHRAGDGSDDDDESDTSEGDEEDEVPAATLAPSPVGTRKSAAALSSPTTFRIDGDRSVLELPNLTAFAHDLEGRVAGVDASSLSPAMSHRRVPVVVMRELPSAHDESPLSHLSQPLNLSQQPLHSHHPRARARRGKRNLTSEEFVLASAMEAAWKHRPVVAAMAERLIDRTIREADEEDEEDFPSTRSPDGASSHLASHRAKPWRPAGGRSKVDKQAKARARVHAQTLIDMADVRGAAVEFQIMEAGAKLPRFSDTLPLNISVMTGEERVEAFRQRQAERGEAPVLPRRVTL